MRFLEREVIITTGIDLPIFDHVLQVVVAFVEVAFISRATPACVCLCVCVCVWGGGGGTNC